MPSYLLPHNATKVSSLVGLKPVSTQRTNKASLQKETEQNWETGLRPTITVFIAKHVQIDIDSELLGGVQVEKGTEIQVCLH